jgi:drug/metabolite transporter superfamily protein YnfA
MLGRSHTPASLSATKDRVPLTHWDIAGAAVTIAGMEIIVCGDGHA